MSYRNDHDAALARAHALEAEVAHLKADAALRVVSLPKPPVRRGVVGIALATALLGGALGVAFAGEPVAPVASDPTPARAMATLDTRINRVALDQCIEGIKPLPTIRGLRLTPLEVTAVEATGAPCRTEIRDYLEQGLWSPDERAALTNWAAAEDRLANSISMVAVYHRDDPIRLDGGATAGQLWSEYARAHADRDATIVIWRNRR